MKKTNFKNKIGEFSKLIIKNFNFSAFFKPFLAVALLIFTIPLISAGDIVVDLSSGELNVTQGFFVDTNILFVNSTSNNVGIGTIFPQKHLEIASNASSDELPTIRLTATNDDAWYANNQVFGALEFYTSETIGNFPAVGAAAKMLQEGIIGTQYGLGFFTNNNLIDASEKMRITATGKVGIGLTNPNSTLQVVTGGTTLASSWDVYSDPEIKANLAEKDINDFDFSTAKLYSYNLKWNENGEEKTSDRTQIGLASTEVPSECVRNAGSFNAVDTYCLLSLAYVKIAQLEAELEALKA